MDLRAARHRSIELVGPPGVGKSTIVRALLRSDGAMRRGRLRDWRSGRLMLAHAFALARPFLHQRARMEGHRAKRFAAMVALETLGTLLDRDMRRRSGRIVFDQGPLYMLSILQRALCPAESNVDNHPAFERYWAATLSRWARRLDLIIVLEAAPEVLRNRVRDRPGDHLMASMTPQEASAFLQRSRTSREKILQTLRNEDAPPTVVRLRTDELTLEQTVERILDLVRTPPT